MHRTPITSPPFSAEIPLARTIGLRPGHADVDPSGGLPYSTHASPGPARAADRTADASA